MFDDDASRRMKAMRAALALSAALALAALGAPAVYAQSIMRSPNLNISSRIPRIDPNFAGRDVPGISAGNIRVRRPCGGGAWGGPAGDHQS